MYTVIKVPENFSQKYKLNINWGFFENEKFPARATALASGKLPIFWYLALKNIPDRQ